MGLPPIDVKIKWANDLYLDGLIVGDILCTAPYELKSFNVSVGLRLILDNEKPTTCLNAELRKLSAAGLLESEDALAAFLNKFEKLHDLFIT